jgi:hypothetical protein
MPDINLTLKEPHPKQAAFIYSRARRIVIRAGRRSGKSTGVAIRAVLGFLQGHRVLYAAPTTEQLGKFWWEATTALAPAIEAGHYHKRETDHIIRPTKGYSEARIKAKTAHDANTLRGDYADDLFLDEYQMMDPDAWRLVGAPMLLDNNGYCTFIYTAEQEAIHARELYRRAERMMNEAIAQGKQPRWEVYNFSSHDNPYLSKEALEEITQDMDDLAYRLEIMAEDIDDDPRALWNRALLKKTRVVQHPDLDRIVVAVDPQGGMVGETGIMVAGLADMGGDDNTHGYLLEDASISADPETWASQVVASYYKYAADRIIAERNFGGDMVERTIRAIDPRVPIKIVTASRGKKARAEPIMALYQRDRIHHVGEFPRLESELVSWYPTRYKGHPSPNRMDALVWAFTELMLDYCATELGSIEIPMW